jgi:putative flippase GtrA
MKSILKQGLRFLSVGVLNTAVGLLVIYMTMYFTSLNIVIANAAGYAVGLLISFIANKNWTFDQQKKSSNPLMKYIIAAGFSYIVNISAVLISIDIFSINEYIAQFCGIFVYTATMFLLCRYFVFINKPC